MKILSQLSEEVVGNFPLLGDRSPRAMLNMFRLLGNNVTLSFDSYVYGWKVVQTTLVRRSRGC